MLNSSNGKFCEKLFYCHQLLNLNRKKRKIKKWEPNLTSEEKILFDQEELLSAYQHIIANASGQHRHRHQVLFHLLILKIFFFKC
jgi:hypothetical protein